MKWFLVAAIAAMALGGLVACGSSETTTVTETITQAESSSEAPAESAPETSPAESAATTSEPTDTTIPDGTWAKGEYTPGQYRAPGGSLCEWEQRDKLSEEAEGAGEWGISERNILAEIDSAFFVTEGCGVWQKVG